MHTANELQHAITGKVSGKVSKVRTPMNGTKLRVFINLSIVPFRIRITFR
jgi:hypothetical protein